jgi:hypothetical protein
LKVEHFALGQVALLDDDEQVRQAGLELVVGVSAVYPDHLIVKTTGDGDAGGGGGGGGSAGGAGAGAGAGTSSNRMIDDAFATVCDMLSDLSVKVR